MKHIHNVILKIILTFFYLHAIKMIDFLKNIFYV